MVGGRVINIVKAADSTWVQCMDRIYSEQTCAIRVKDAKEMKVGDAIWWHGNRAYWTPKPDEGREDVPLERIGYSHSNIPEDVMESLA